ncbi:MAG: glucose 1-dehydrogenase [Proteiniphilum sp.]|uniref:SDR family NAD(P)-dependent oxidoreductase n=1 Tax=Proteiniphilum sp. TaxID=1926877 RepID=UPI002ABB9E72|nr:glucose 1-dehydrogenase [Proteiniphilum sp.]MDY9919960.1 glucose 1-dehydrogenase [Proteiniphilum sp.]
MKLKNKVAIVTGGARDLGREVSLRLAKEGAKVVINYFDNIEDAEATKRLIMEIGGQAIFVQGDMTKEEDVKKLFATARETYGDHLDVLVNVVGGLVGRKKITEQDLDWYNFLMDVNMKSCYLCTREAVPMMGKGASIINFSSQAARDGGGAGASLYATSKGAVMTFTRSMAKELGPDGIRVNAVAPGMIATSFHDKFSSPEGRKNVAAGTPLRREGIAYEIADLVAYLASDESSFITGTNIDINGGTYYS